MKIFPSKSKLAFPTSAALRLGRKTGVCLALTVLGATQLRAQNTVYEFNNFDGNGRYSDGQNWDQGTVPNLQTTNTAHINDGSAVTYTAGPDLIIKNGGMLQVSNGSYTQAGGNNYLQLNGGGTILVDGGTFNQGTVSSTPFNVTGTGNALTISAGTINLNKDFNISLGLTFTQTGGTVNDIGETNFNGGSVFLNGGQLNTQLVTGANAGNNSSVFNIGGGVLNITTSKFSGIYPANGTTQYINFTLNSTGLISFTSGTEKASDVQAFVNNGQIKYNGLTNASAFTVTQNGTTVILSLAGTAVPEPSAVVLGGLAAAALVVFRRRRN